MFDQQLLASLCSRAKTMAFSFWSKPRWIGLTPVPLKFPQYGLPGKSREAPRATRPR
jgi:hypothetical protein